MWQTKYSAKNSLYDILFRILCAVFKLFPAITCIK